MKLFTPLSLLLAATFIFSGCDSSSNSDETSTSSATTTSVSGKTTLSKGLVCVDANTNGKCDEGEESTTTSEDGSYTLSLNTAISDGAQLVAQDGQDLILFQNNLHKLYFYASYQSSESATNINAMTTLISQKMAAEGMSYGDAKAYYASKYAISVENIVADPIEMAKTEPNLLKFTNAVEQETVDNATAKSSQAKQRFFLIGGSNPGDTTTQESNTTSVNEGDADAATEDGSYLDFDVDAYLNKLYEYIDAIKNYFLSLYDDYFGDGSTLLPGNAIATREDINGMWFVKNDKDETSCVEIDALDNFTIYDKTSSDAYTLNYNADKRELNVEYGFSTVETFILSSFTENTFQATYSDGAVSGTRESDLAACRAKL